MSVLDLDYLETVSDDTNVMGGGRWCKDDKWHRKCYQRPKCDFKPNPCPPPVCPPPVCPPPPVCRSW